jgi:aminoglycoside phosphotransferase (APT) family kinase protein
MSSAGTAPGQSSPASDAGERWPERFRPVLAKLTAQLAERHGRAPSILAVRELQRPFSTVLRVRIVTRSERRFAYVKIIQPRADTPEEHAATRRNVEREYRVTSDVRDILKNVPGLGAVVPIACIPEEWALVTEEVPGTTLARVLSLEGSGWPAERKQARLEQTLRRAAAWLQLMQRRMRAGREMTAETIRRYLDRRIAQLSTSPGGTLTPSGRSRVEACRDRLLDEACRTGVQGVWIHADFCPDNLIAGTDAMTVLDFTMAGAGTRYHDLAHLYLSLDALRAKPWFKHSIVDRWQEALLEGFERGLTPRHPLFVLARFQHVLCHLVALQQTGGQLARFVAGWRRRRYRAWLTEVAGLDRESWAR